MRCWSLYKIIILWFEHILFDKLHVERIGNKFLQLTFPLLMFQNSFVYVVYNKICLNSMIIH